MPSLSNKDLRQRIEHMKENVDTLTASLRELETQYVKQAHRPKYRLDLLISGRRDDGSTYIGKIVELIPHHRGWRYKTQVHKRFYKSDMGEDRWLYKEHFEDDLMESYTDPKNLIPVKFRPKKKRNLTPRRDPAKDDLGNIDITVLQDAMNSYLERILQKEVIE